MRVRLVLALTLALAAVATPASGAVALKRYAIAGEGASIGVPKSWVSITSRELVTRSLFEQLVRENPRLAPFLQAFAQSGSALKFLALDPAVRGGFATNVNVVSAPLPRPLSFAQYRQLLLAEVRVLTRGGKVASSVVRIGGARAVRLSYRFRLTAGRTFTVQTLQYAFLRGGKSLVVTYTTVPRYAGTYAATFRASAASIRFS